VEGLGEIIQNLGPLGGISAGSVLIFLVIMVFLGKIPTPATVTALRERIADKDAEIGRKDVEIAHWRTAWTNINAAQLETSKQLEKLVEKTDVAAARDELVVSLLQSIRNQAGLTP
jgi:hypothetical protein